MASHMTLNWFGWIGSLSSCLAHILIHTVEATRLVLVQILSNHRRGRGIWAFGREEKIYSRSTVHGDKAKKT